MQLLSIPSELPIRYRYHLGLSRRRGFNLTPQIYFQLKRNNLIVDTKAVTRKEGKYQVIVQQTQLNNSLRKICTATQINIDTFGNSEAIILVLEEFQRYAPKDVARQLRSLLGDLIKRYGLQA